MYFSQIVSKKAKITILLFMKIPKITILFRVLVFGFMNLVSVDAKINSCINRQLQSFEMTLFLKLVHTEPQANEVRMRRRRCRRRLLICQNLGRHVPPPPPPPPFGTCLQCLQFSNLYFWSMTVSRIIFDCHDRKYGNSKKLLEINPH